MKYYPYGVTRYTSGNTPTPRRFTGQLSEEATLGSLYFFNARFYSPYLNRWIQPDTIVPDPANPQSLNRYVYVLNNPVKYTDPSGHMETDGCDIEGCTLPIGYKANSTWQRPDGILVPYDPALAEKYPAPLVRTAKEVGQFVDQALYRILPSTIGVEVQVSLGSDPILVAGVDVSPLGFQFVCNWRSFQCEVLFNPSVDLRGGTPRGASASLSIRPFLSWGASNLDNYKGPYEFIGGDIGPDVILSGAVTVQKTQSVRVVDPQRGATEPLIDPVSRMIPTTYELGVQFGVNVLPNYVEGNLYYGRGNSVNVCEVLPQLCGRP